MKPGLAARMHAHPVRTENPTNTTLQCGPIRSTRPSVGTMPTRNSY